MTNQLTLLTGSNCHLCDLAKALLNPLVIEKGGMALNPRGELYTSGNIKARLNMRDFMDTMRSSGLQVGGGPPPLSQKDRMAFANALDRYIATHQK